MALRRLAQNTAGVIGCAIVGVLVAVLGSGWAIAIDALTFAVAAGCFALIRVPAIMADSSLLAAMVPSVRRLERR